MRTFFTKLAWILLPLILASIAAGLISMSEYSDIDIVMRSSAVVATLSLGGVLSAALFLIWVGATRRKKRIKRALVLQNEDSKEEHKRFVQRLDHELKNPITSIQLGLQNLKRNVDPANLESIKSLLDQSARLSQLTTDLRKIAVLDEQTLEFEHISVSSLLTNLKDMFLEIEHGRKIELILPSAPWPVPNIYADSDLLELALYNIVENAIKYSNLDDRIEIRASDDRKNVKIEVADTGLGLIEEEHAQVWEELFRGSNTRERSGTGIGLSLVKRIIEQHKGRIDFDSKRGVGTRVSIHLPISNLKTVSIKD